jgi:hypothetical protein
MKAYACVSYLSTFVTTGFCQTLYKTYAEESFRNSVLLNSYSR